MVAPLIVGGAIAAAGSILGGLLGNSGASDAADAYEKAAKAAAASAEKLYYQGRSDLAPYTQLGQGAIQNLMGTPAQYAATPEELNTLVSQRDALTSQLNTLQTKGEAYTVKSGGQTITGAWDTPNAPQTTPVTTTTKYKPADPAKIAQLQDQLTKINGQITTTQQAMGQEVTPAQPGLMDQFPNLPAYPDMPAYPEGTPPPTAPAYPDMPAQPVIDYGQGAPVENALISFQPGQYEASAGYQFQVGEAQKAVERMAAARGYRLSPRALDEFSQQAQGLAQTDYNSWFNQQLQKADLALSSWQSGRNAAIQDWINPYQMSVADWERARGSELQDWSNQRGAALQDYTTKATAESSNWMDKYNAQLNLLRIGQNSAAGTANQANNLGTNLANIQLGAGQMEADKYITQANNLANALTSGIQNVLTAYNSNPSSAYTAPNIMPVNALDNIKNIYSDNPIT